MQISSKVVPALTPGSVDTVQYGDITAGSSSTRSLEALVTIPTGAPELHGLSATSLVPEDPNYSTALGYISAKLVDDDFNSLAYPGGTTIDYAVNLGGEADVSGASIRWGVFGTNSIYVNAWTLYYRDGATAPWIQAATGGFPGTSVMDVALGNLRATDLRITATSSNWIGAYEMKVYGTRPVPLLNSTNSGITAQALNGDSSCAVSSGYQAANLVDGDLNSLAYPCSTEVYYMVYLPSVAHVRETDIRWGVFGTNSLYVNQWHLSWMDINGNWTTAASGASPQVDTFSASTDLYTSRLWLYALSQNWIGVYDLGLRASLPVTPVGVYSNLPESYPAYSAANLVDGNDGTVGYPGGDYIDYVIDLGTKTNIDVVDINWGDYGYTGYVQNWSLYGQSDDALGWDLLATGGTPNQSDSKIQVSHNAQRLRLTANGPNWIGVNEVTVYGR